MEQGSECISEEGPLPSGSKELKLGVGFRF